MAFLKAQEADEERRKDKNEEPFHNPSSVLE
jgi:hypothetical protein